MAYTKLSDAYRNTPDRYAKCPCCYSVYLDDLPIYGSLISPCCPDYALVRGVDVTEKLDPIFGPPFYLTDKEKRQIKLGNPYAVSK